MMTEAAEGEEEGEQRQSPRGKEAEREGEERRS